MRNGTELEAAEGRRDCDGSFSLSVGRALQILELFSPERTELGITDISRELAVPKANIQRLVGALCRHEFLDQNSKTRKYRVGFGAFQVGSLFASNRTLEQMAQPFMRELVAGLGQTCHLSVLRDCFMIVTASIEGPSPIKYSIPIGYRLPMNSSAVGKAALSKLADVEVDAIIARAGMAKRTPYSITDPEQFKRELATIRSRGYSVNWEENRPGIGSVAAPVLGPGGALAAVLSVGFPVSLVPKSELPVYGAAVTKKADALAAKLGYAPAAPRSSRGAADTPSSDLLRERA